MTGWLIYDKKQYEINKWFADELIKNCSSFCTVKLIISENLKFGISDNAPLIYGEHPVEFPDFAIIRTIYPLLSFFLEENGVRLFNPSAVSNICNDKRLTYTAVAKSGVAMMPSVFFSKRFLDGHEEACLEFPCVLKSADGHGGKEVFLLNGREEYRDAVGKILSDGFLVQKVCATGRDVRVYVLGGEIIGAVLRSSNSFKSNYTLGGKAEGYDLSKKEVETVKTVIGCLPVRPDFVGVDFLPDNGRLIFNEIEDVVGTRMLYSALNIDAAHCFSEYIKLRTTKSV